MRQGINFRECHVFSSSLEGASWLLSQLELVWLTFVAWRTILAEMRPELQIECYEWFKYGLTFVYCFGAS